jgi:autophagy-related protein 2
MLASGQTYDPNADELNATLFNSVYVGLDQDAAELDGDDLAAAIDEELEDSSDAASESSWQFQGQPSAEPESRDKQRPSSLNRRNLTRSRSPNIEFSIQGLSAEFDQYLPNQALVSKVLVTIRDFEILDHIRTSTWSKFLTAMMKDSKGNVRETESNMVRLELQTLQPVREQSDQEARLKVRTIA